MKNATANLGRLDSFTKGVDHLKDAVAEFTSQNVSKITGIDSATIENIATEFASAKRAVVYGRMGVSTQPHGGLCHWFINAINLVTGNLDRAGGHMFANPAVKLVGKSGTTDEFGRWKSRVRGLPEFEGDLPVAVLAEEMLTPGKGQIKAFVTSSGNPVLSTPNGAQLERALEQLDFYVAHDIYINETTRHADLILPSPSGLETDHYDFVFLALAVRNVAKYSPQIFAPEAGSMYDWQIMKELALRLMPKGKGFAGRLRSGIQKRVLRWLTPDRLLDLGLKTGPYGWFRKGLSLKKLKANPNGIDLGELQPMLPKALRTVRQKNQRSSTSLPRPLEASRAPAADRRNRKQRRHIRQRFLLIGRRHLRSNNSWMHNSQRLVKGADRCTLMMHTNDAEKLNLVAGAVVAITSGVGSVKAPLEVTDEIMPGVVSLPHGYGHHRPKTKLSVASQHAGVSINDLTDDKIVDNLTGNAAFSAQTVRIEATNDE